MGEQKNDRRMAPRRDSDRAPLSEAEIERLAEIIGQRIEEKIYLEIGKTTVRAAFYIVGAACLALLGWANLNEKLTFTEAFAKIIAK